MQMSAFKGFWADIHYYAGGLKTATPGQQQRPQWTPPPNFVGFQDEFTLGPDDYVIELRRVIYNGNPLSWVACYTKSIDKNLGDRDNYAGIGIWICGLTLLQASWLLASLRNVAKLIASEGYSDNVDRLAGSFIREFLPKYFVSSEELPPGFSGIPYGTGVLPQTSLYRCEPGQSTVRHLEIASAALLNAFLANAPFCHTDRLLILLPTSTADKEQSAVLLDEGVKLATDILAGLKAAWDSSVQEFQKVRTHANSLETSLRDASNALYARDESLRHLQSQLTEANEKIQALETLMNEVRSSPDYGVAQRLSDLSAKVGQVLTAVQASQRPGNRAKGLVDLHQESGREPQSSSWLLFWSILAGGLGLIAIIAVVIKFYVFN
jgi:hypothetical protein